MIYLQPVTISQSLRIRRSEWGGAGCMAFFGFILLAPYDTFSTSPSFAIMAGLMSEQAWGWVAIILGLSRLGVLIYNGRWRRTNHARAVFAALSCFFWTAVAGGLILTGTWPTGVAPYTMLLLMDLHTIYESMFDAKCADEHRRGHASST